MPINIYRVVGDGGKKNQEIAWLCDDVWEMPPQLKALEEWLVENRGKLPSGDYIADLGFSPRPDASGGGGVVGTAMMKTMLELGIELFLSEYPPFSGPADEEP